MESKLDSPSLLQSISEDATLQYPAPEDWPGPAAVTTRKTLSQVAESIIRRLLSLYALRRPLSILILVIVDALALLAGFGLSSYLIGSGRWAEKVLYLSPI